jgi:hypothetical protein
VQRALAKACKARGAAAVAWSNALDGLLAVASDPPDVLAIDAECSDVKITDAIRALKKTARTANVAVVVYDAPARANALAKLAVSSIVARGKTDDAVRALVELLDAREER